MIGRRHGLLVLALVVPGHAGAQTPPRVTLPVHLVVLPDAARRYFVSITVGGTPIEAGLDTGSVGLRILPGTLQPGAARLTGRPERVAYGSGTVLDGVVASAPLDIGGIRGDVSFEQVDAVGCAARQPRCPASRVPLREFGIMGDGLPGQGFRAILGIGRAAASIDNPLRRLGVTRFLIEVPLGLDRPGRLILNPAADDLRDFVAIPAYRQGSDPWQAPDGAVAGCMVDRIAGDGPCGAVVLDTGAPGIEVDSPDRLGDVWRNGTPARLVLGDGQGHPLAAADMTIGAWKDAARLSFRQMSRLPKTIIRAGIAPYLAFSVLYDFDQGGLSVRPRQQRAP